MNASTPEVNGTSRAAELDAREWDGLVGPQDFFLSHRWLGSVEDTAGVPMEYFTLRRDGRAVAALATALADGAEPWKLGRTDSLLEYCAAEGFPQAEAFRAGLPGPAGPALMPGLVCGGRHLGRTRVLCGAEATRADVAELVRRAEDAAAARGGRSVAFLYVDEDDTLLGEVLDERGYDSFVSGRHSRLDVPAGGFEEYLARLSAHRRRRILAERRAVRAAGVEVRLEPLAAAPLPRLAELETRLLAKYGFADWRPEQTELVLHSVLERFGDDAVVSLAVADGTVQGFGLQLRHGDQWYAHRAGFDYDFQGRLPLYYEVLYYHLVQQAPAHGVSVIHYGLGSEEAKRSRGCRATTQRCYVLRPDAADRPAPA
ncbi:hypothetical protein GCM10010495_10370 [Kitasatospora herbaricolor]|uniref:GNAT family N-acetyltransferase n=1 Tax=Kitasatospora herbaricolor TaxID=68217 RepID=UPI00174BD1C8|nr:GNAT family N-acetyltransferase [Kitasatospora herbaricolor]MDQ0309528.1 putative N-acyltransferase [Kitasatospora herbaricolor]GGV01254.1 hypothetical protein GCM10010495_10370 [Kitasatospora herbaricolor]